MNWVGYLACALMLHESDDLLLLLVNTILRDLKSTNVVEINMALIAVASSNLVPAEMAPLLVPIICERTRHSKDFIRKKALICLGQLYQNQSQTMSFNSSFTGSHISPEMSQFMEDHVQECLTDVDPGVVGVSVQVLTTIMLTKSLYSNEKTSIFIPQSIEGLILGLLSIQEQILDGKLPQKEYNYQELPAPWMQVDILHLLSIFFRHKIAVKENVKDDVWIQATQILLRTFEHISLHGGSKNIIGHAIDLECTFASAALLSITTDSMNGAGLEDTHLQPSVLQSSLHEKASKHMLKFVQSKNSNMKYAGLSGLEKLLQNSEIELINRNGATPETVDQLEDMEKLRNDLQNAVMMCLENSDAVIRQKSLSLLPLMATARNVQSICDKIIGQIRLQPAPRPEESYGRVELIDKVLGMAERFFLRSCNKVSFGGEESVVTFDWYVFVLVRLLQAAHGEQRDAILVKIKRTLFHRKMYKQDTSMETEIESQLAKAKDNDIIKVGTKLTGILRKLVFNNLTTTQCDTRENQVRYGHEHDLTFYYVE